jgi:structural maintenance of chromosome 4
VDVEFVELDTTSPKTESYTDDGYDIIPHSQFILSRIAYRDNTSNYLINDKRCSFGEVEKFMMTKGVDVGNNRFLILQGEVEAIAMMPPKGANKREEGLLEFLEDLIGTCQYVEDIEKGQALVESLSEIRSEQLSQVKIVEKELAVLEGPMNEAVKFKNLEVEKNMKLVMVKTSCVARAEQARNEISNKYDTLRSQYKEQDMALSSKKREVKELETTFDKLRNEHSKLATAMETAVKEYATYERRAIQDGETLKRLLAKKDKAEDTYNKSKEKLQQLRSQIEQASVKVQPLMTQVKLLEKELVTLEENVEKIRVASRHESESIHKELDGKNTALAPLAAAQREAESEVQVVQTELDLCSRETLRSRVLLKEAQQQVQEIESTIASTHATIKVERTFHSQQQQKLDTMLTRVKSLEETESTIAEELAVAKVNLEKATSLVEKQQQQQQNKQSKTTTSTANANKTTDVLKILLDATKTKNGPLYQSTLAGRLGDLGTIPIEYDVAVTTAAPMLDALVCETIQGAERCVTFLREQNLGTSTFIILEKLTYLQGQMDDSSNNKWPASATRLFDLITPKDEKFKLAFYFALRDTLVAKNLDEATSLAFVDGKAKYRVVTLGGDLIDISGTMAGGGKARKGGMSQQQGTVASLAAVDGISNPENEQIVPTEKEMKQMDKQVQDLTQAHGKALSALKACRGEIDTLEKTCTESSRKIAKLEMELESLSQKLSSVKTHIGELEPKCEASQEERKRADELRVVLDGKIKKRNQCVAAASSLQAEVELLQRRLAAVGGDKMKTAKAQVELCRSRLDAERNELTKSEVASEAGTVAINKLSTQVEKAGGEFEKALAAYETLLQSVSSNEAKAREVLIGLERAKEAEAEKRSACDRIKKEHLELRNSLNVVENATVEMKIQLDAYDDEIKSHKSAVEKWKKELHTAQVALEQWKQVDQQQQQQQNSTSSSEVSTTTTTTEENELKDNTELQPSPIIVDEVRLEAEIKSLEAQAAPLRGNVNMGAIAEYSKREKEYLIKVAELDDATAKRDAARLACDELRKKRLVEFMAGFSVISLKLKEIYQLITLGGDAELELVDSLDPFSEGVVFSVRPPKKSWKNISNLSGGEKTLSSLSLVFALHHYKPAPLYVMDEIDAALDFKNVSIVANYIKERTTNAQFVIISLRNNMFELADRLVGVYKTNNATKSVTVNPNKVALKSGLMVTSDEQENVGTKTATTTTTSNNS